MGWLDGYCCVQFLELNSIFIIRLTSKGEGDFMLLNYWDEMSFGRFVTLVGGCRARLTATVDFSLGQFELSLVDNSI